MLRLNNVETYTELINRLVNINTLKELIEYVESYIEEHFHAEYTGIYIYNEKEQKLELKFAFGFTEEERKIAEKTAMQRHPGMVFKTKQGFYIPDTLIDNHSADSPRSFHVRSRLYEPIVVDDKTVGVFGIVSIQPSAFSELQRKFFRLFCTTCSIAFENIKQREQLKNLNRELLVLSYIATKTDNGVILANKKGEITWSNESFLKFTGYELDELIGKRPGQLLQGKDSDPKTVKFLGESIHSRKEVKDVEIINYKKNGEKYYALLDIYPVVSNDGEQLFISLQKDITRSKKVQDIINKERIKLNKIIETLPDAILILNKNGIINQIHANIKIKKVIDYIDAKKKNYKLFISKKYHKLIDIKINQSLKSNSMNIIVVPIILMKKKYIIEVRISKFEDNDILAVLRDITEQHNALKVKKQNDKLAEIISTYSFRLTFIDKLQLERYIYEMLAETGSVLNADTLRINEYINEYKFNRTVFDWAKEENKSTEFCNFLYVNEDMPNWNKKILMNEIIVIEDTNLFDKRLLSSYESNEISKSKTIIGIPITVNDIRYGFLILETFNKKVQVTKEILNHLKLVSNIIVNALFRRKWSKEIERSKIYLDNSLLGIIIINSNNDVVYFNKKSVSILNNANKYTYTKLKEFFPFENCNIELSYENLVNINGDIILTMNDNEGKDRFFNLNINIFDDITSLNNNDRNVAIAFSEITNELENRKELEKSLEILNNQNKQLTNFSFMVSHNLRSHASTLSSFIDLLKDETDECEKQILLKGLKKTSKNLEETLRDMTALIKTKNQFDLEYSQVYLEELVSKIVNAIYSEMADVEHEIKLDIEDDLLLNTIPSYLESIITNLFTNSFKYRKLGHKLIIEIKAELCNNCFTLHFKDNGIGIDLKKNREKLFGLFSTFHSRANSQGIGLHLVKIQIEKLGGTIEVNSEEDKGTEFIIEIPQ